MQQKPPPPKPFPQPEMEAWLHVETNAVCGRCQQDRGPSSGLAEAGRGSGQPEACPAAERGLRSAGWPKAERDDSFRHRRGC